jgi:hypothetical protein
MQRWGVILAVLLVGGPVLGQAPVGPSTAVLNGARFGVFGEYGRTNADIGFEGGSGKADVDFQTAYAGFAAALTNRWDFFLRVGGSQAEATGFEGGWNVSWGLGTRITAFQWHAFSWGVMGQLTNLVSDFDTFEVFTLQGTPTLLAATDELNLMEYILATGPTWRQGRFSLHGGLLLRYLDGELEALAKAANAKLRADIDARWDAGGYIGGGVTLFERDPSHTYGFSRCDLTAEGRFTADTTGFSVGLLLPFGGES